MNQSQCTFPGNRDDALIACLYDDGDGDQAARTAFATHVATCTQCGEELAALRGVRTRLARWAPPEPSYAVAGRQSSVISPLSSGTGAIRNPPWWQQIPAWAQVAAALLFLGVSAGIANLDVRYDANGLSVRTGWSSPSREARAGESAKTPAASVTPVANAAVATPWRTDIAALERQLQELRAAQLSAQAAARQMPPARAASTSDADVERRVRALLEESEKRQKTELALRVAEMMRDVNAQRTADLVKIDRTLGAVQNSLGVEVMRDRQKLNTLLIRTSGGNRD
jgi:hypothetical protein